ncbi:nonsense-mediated mRNA decay factor SMG5-like isoform X4 [Tachypleus tridentatus]|uniref:nonsense-mediated mRNA decay factor SMG5-like isoform X4 n=1 Tax=Tachypleus tridentatus TaxID=6853 RepID=UPI003FD00498
MMWNMVHLWLKADVNDLESKVKGGGFPQLSPYLVPDISSFCQHLALLKQLRLSKRFVIVVPSVVTAGLDERKKESVGAREAIRWLENELRHGTRQRLVSRPRMFKLRAVVRILKTRPQAINQKIRTTLQHPSVISCL